MKFDLRKYSIYAFCKIEHEGVTLDLGALDNSEAKRLLEDFKAAIDDLEWFTRTTEVE